MTRKYSQEEVWELMTGRIYINKDDANIFVKRKGVSSLTMNLGNKLSWIIMALELIAVITILWVLL